ncbi:MAG: hypothetical protein KA124_05530 [Luteimonas sp.]|nr:hypothetical protein [Luteimonas sp.]
MIHLEEVRGGCLFYAARFCFVSTHSHLRQRLLGRNLITVFSTVNTPGEIFFRTAAVEIESNVVVGRTRGRGGERRQPATPRFAWNESA